MTPPLISTIVPLAGNATFTSTTQYMQRATAYVGTVYADQDGTVYIDQSNDDVNYDFPTSYAVVADTGFGFNVEAIAPYFRVRFTNGSSSTQTVFRLFANALDVYGTFLAAAEAPSAGGAYAVLVYEAGTNTYAYIGRFDGLDGFNACSNAALSQNASGKYAAFPVSAAIVSDETITKSTSHQPDSF